MKTRKIVYFILMYLPLATAVAALGFLPDRIPAHYGFDNQVTRWGSKYEALIYPAVTIFLGYYLLAMAKVAARHEEQGKNNEKFVVTSGILILGLFNVLNAYALYTDFNRVENLSEVPLDLIRLIFGIEGVLMIVMGNFMPKLRMNSVVGLRTGRSMKSEAVWKKCQRFGGISFMVGGIATIGCCLALKGMACLLAVMGVLGLLIIVDAVAVRKIAARN